MARVAQLRHHVLATTADKYRVEVWADMPPTLRPGAPPDPVTLFVDGPDFTSSYVELTPNEARALAALLIVAAEQQENDK